MAWLVFWLVFLTATNSQTARKIFYLIDFVYRWTESCYATMAELRLVYAHDVIPFVAFQLFSHALVGVGAGLATRLIIDALRGRCNRDV